MATPKHMAGTAIERGYSGGHAKAYGGDAGEYNMYDPDPAYAVCSRGGDATAIGMDGQDGVTCCDPDDHPLAGGDGGRANAYGGDATENGTCRGGNAHAEHGDGGDGGWGITPGGQEGATAGVAEMRQLAAVWVPHRVAKRKSAATTA